MKKWYFVVPFLILILGLGILIIKSQSNQTRVTQSVQTAPASSPNSKVEYICQKGQSAFDLLNEKNQIKFSDSSFGKMITSINGVEQGNGKYWLYIVDQKEATISASGYICQSNEKITWELK